MIGFSKRKSAPELIAEQRKQLALIEVDIAKLTNDRDAKLIEAAATGDTQPVYAFDADLGQLRADASRVHETIAALENEAEREVATAAAKLRQRQFAMADEALTAADKIAGELQRLVEKELAPKFAKLLALRADAERAFPFPSNVAPALAFGERMINRLLAHEFYRVSAEPGGTVSVKNTLPGAAAPHPDVVMRPEAIKPFAEQLHEHSNHARLIMRQIIEG